MKISFVSIFLIFFSFELYAGHQGDLDENESIVEKTVEDIIPMMSGRILEKSDLHQFLEGKILYGYFPNNQKFEAKYYSLNTSLDEYGNYKLGLDYTGDYIFKSNGQEIKGKWYIKDWREEYYWRDICYEINGNFSGCSQLVEHNGKKYDAGIVYYFADSDSFDNDLSIVARITKIVQFEEGLASKTERLKEEKYNKEQEELELKNKKERDEKKQNELKTGVKLVKAYANYIMLKNLNDTYGSSKELNNAKTHIKFIEDYYKDKVEIDIDTLWEKGKARYQEEYARSAEIFASDFSAEGLKAFKVLKRELLDEANANGFSSSNTDKDF